MKYTDAQKKKLCDAILPHICVEGGTLLLDQNGKITSDLSTYNYNNLIIPIELLKPEHEKELQRQLAYYMVPRNLRIPNIRSIIENNLGHPIDIVQLEKDIPNTEQFIQVIVKIYATADQLAKEHRHTNTPYDETKKMKRRKESMAVALARSCPEEAELLYYKNLTDNKKTSILLTDDFIPTNDLSGGLAAGTAEREGIIVNDTFWENPKYHSSRDRTAYEEIVHWADEVLGHDVAHTYWHLSESLLSKATIEPILDKASTATHQPSFTKASRRAYRKALGETKDTVPDNHQSKIEENRQKVHGSKFQMAMEVFSTIAKETKLDQYTAAKNLFYKQGSTSLVATEILAKTYASLLACRDRMQKVTDSFDFNAFVRYAASQMPAQGKAALLYCRVRDEYLNQLRAEHKDRIIAPPEPGSEINPTYWQNVITDITKHNQSSHK